MQTGTHERSLLTGAVDAHVHSSPDALPRRQWDSEVVADADEAGMAAVVLKNHLAPTAGRASIANRTTRRLRVLGGVVLNRSVGGLNPEVVRTALAFGGRVVWMPTVSAANHLEYLGRQGVGDHIRAISSSRGDGITIRRSGPTFDSLSAILDLIAESDAVLATGHLSTAETEVVVKEAKRRGVTRILVTHPEAPQIRMPIDLQADLARVGVRFERTYYSVLAGTQSAAEMLETARSVGIHSTVLATDLGQEHNAPAVTGFLDFGEAMIDAGMSELEWRSCTAHNPAAVLGLPDAEEAE